MLLLYWAPIAEYEEKILSWCSFDRISEWCMCTFARAAKSNLYASVYHHHVLKTTWGSDCVFVYIWVCMFVLRWLVVNEPFSIRFEDIMSRTLLFFHYKDEEWNNISQCATNEMSIHVSKDFKTLLLNISIGTNI